MDFLSWIIHIPILAWLSWRFYLKQQANPLFFCYWPALGLKLLAGIALNLTYLYYYKEGDLIFYVEKVQAAVGLVQNDPAAVLHFVLTDHFSESYREILGVFEREPRAQFFFKYLIVVFTFCLKNYWIAGFYLSFLSFAAVFKLAGSLVVKYPRSTVPAIMAFLFWPPLLFWSSGLMKEALAVTCIAWLVNVLLNRVKISWFTGISLIPVSWLLFQLKFYYAVVLLPLLIGIVLSETIGRRFSTSGKVLVMLILVMLLIVPFTLMNEYLRPDDFIRQVVINHNSSISSYFSRSSMETSFVAFPDLSASLWSMLYYIPKALFTGLFEPRCWNVSNIFQLVDSIFNLLILISSVYALTLFFLKRGRDKVSLDCLAVGIYVLVLAVLLTFASPALGTLTRYRVGYMPFYLYLVLNVFDWERPEAFLRSILPGKVN